MRRRAIQWGGSVLIVFLCAAAGVVGQVNYSAAGIAGLTSGTTIDSTKGLCVYNTVADPLGNYERVCLAWNSGIGRFEVKTEKGGTGTVRGLRIAAGTGQDLQLGGNAATTWEILSSTGNLQPAADDTRSLGLNGKGLQFVNARRGFMGSKPKTLAEASATNVVQFSVATDNFADATLQYAAFCSDGTNHLLRRGAVYVAAVAEGTTVTTLSPTEVGTPIVASVGGGTFSAFTWDTSTTNNNVMVRLTATCSLTQTTLDLYHRPDTLNSVATYTITPQ